MIDKKNVTTIICRYSPEVLKFVRGIRWYCRFVTFRDRTSNVVVCSRPIKGVAEVGDKIFVAYSTGFSVVATEPYRSDDCLMILKLKSV